MLNRKMQSVFYVAALLLVSAIPAAAQNGGAASVGVAFATKDVGTGINADYARVFRDMGMDRSQSWLVDFSWNHNSIFDVGINTVLVQAGWRYSGRAGDKATFHGQVGAGIARFSASAGGLVGELCDLVGEDCSEGDTDFVITPAGGLTYWFSDTKGVKGQLNIPIAGGDSFVRFDINVVFKLGS